MEQWEGKVAVVAGASSGIGRAIALKLAQDGLKIAALARRENKLRELENSDTCKGMIKGYVCDVTVDSQVEIIMNQIETEMGPIRILVNSAGLYYDCKFGDLEIDKWRDMLNVHFFGTFTCIKYLVQLVKAHERGTVHIININTAEPTSFPDGDWIPYIATKIPPKMLTRGLFKRFAEEKLDIKITGVDPGFVLTGIQEHLMEQNPDAIDIFADVPTLDPAELAETIKSVITSPQNAIVSSITVQPVGETM